MAANPRAAAVAALVRQEQDGFSNLVLDAELKRQQLEGRDKAFASAIFYTVLEHQGTLDYILCQFLPKGLAKLDAPVREILRAALAQAPAADTASSPALAVSPALSSTPSAAAGIKPPPAAAPANPYGLAALWAQGDLVAKATLVVLVIMSVSTWYVLITKLLAQRRIGGQGRAALGPELVLQIQRFNPAVLCFQSLLQPAHQPAGGRQATQAQLAALRGENDRHSAWLHSLERQRDRLLSDDSVLPVLVAANPGCDVQQLRTLIRNARKEQTEQKPLKAYRELFQQIKSTLAAAAAAAETSSSSSSSSSSSVSVPSVSTRVPRPA